jgi:uncharacterized lipoprotein
MSSLHLAPLSILSLALMPACAFNEQKVTLAPKVVLATSTLGQGVSVAVGVVDERPSQSLGRRGTAYGAAAEITTDQDVGALVRTEIENGLRQHGFNIAATGADTQLVVEIRLLEYKTSTGFWTGGVNVQAALKAIATRAEHRFEHLYRTDNENRVVISPTADTNEAWINAGLSDVLTKLLSDATLLDALRK